MTDLDPTPPLLAVAGLRVRFAARTGQDAVDAVRGVTFSMGREKLGIVGESGSGKSLTARAILRLMPPGAAVTADHLAFDGIDLLQAGRRTLRRLRGASIGMVMQDPKYSLNPVMRVGRQIGEALRGEPGLTRPAVRERVVAMLHAVRIRDPERVYRAWPHELSGGMAQRAMIAMMLIRGPDLLIADEPTSALDVTVQRQVLGIIDDLVAAGREKDGAASGMGLLLISHDLNLVAGVCDRVLVMYAGRIVESLPARDLGQATHPYTRGLLAARPSLAQPRPVLPVLDRDPAWEAEA
jgi:peptide/nickel transport system ATP-binding protein